MEQTEVKKRGRGRPRKRRREDEEEEKEDKIGNALRRQAFDISWRPIVGRYLLKEFPGNGIFLGKVVYYDSGLYRVDYEDGDCEDLDRRELVELILWDSEFHDDLSRRKWKLDELLLEKRLQQKGEDGKCAKKAKRGLDVVRVTRNAEDVSLSDSSDNEIDDDLELKEQTCLVPPLNLPSSSGTINVPEDCASYFFSVYTFLRSFSVQLFLYPFSIDDFAGAINCLVQNNLIDAIHVALMHAIRRHLEILSSDGSELPIKFLRFMNWSLLDTFTWPAFVLHYFTIAGYIERPEWAGLSEDLIKKEYYTIPPGRKIKILQLLCDDALDSFEIKAEVDIRGEAEVGIDPDFSVSGNPDSIPRRVHLRHSKPSACKDGNDFEAADGRSNPSVSLKYFSYNGDGGVPSSLSTDGDGNVDECRLCGMDGTLICCDGCPSAYHTRCVGLVKMQIPEGPWYCPECTIMKVAPISSSGTLLSGAVFFGIDPYEQVFLGTCNHLLVLGMADESCHRYYNETDIVGVLQVLLQSAEHKPMYLELSRAIAQYWKQQGALEKILSSLPCSENISNGEINLVNENSAEILRIDQSMSDEQPVDSFNGNGNASSCAMMSASESAPYAYWDTCHSNSSHLSYSNFSDINCPEKNLGGSTLYMGTLFKPNFYVNYYVHGEYSAAAAAKLAVVAEESRGLEVHKSSVGRKASSDISLQVKAFSAVSPRFFWPCNEKKLVEIPRERCGWCYSCKLPSNSRRGCYLNAAAATATKSAWKVLGGLRPAANAEGSLRSISAYILYLEEMLHGLTVGFFNNTHLRAQWRRRVEDAPSYLAMKEPLLELEENIRPIGLSPDWHKFPDDWCFESFVVPTALLYTSTSQKRAFGNKFGRKHYGGVDSAADDADDKSFLWWHGASLSNFGCYKASLPAAVAKNAARKAGVKKMPGVSYAEEGGVPKRSRCLVWRSTVETSGSSAQLAFLVRYLDSHVRWNDLVRADQNPQDPKGPETELSFFRNAVICDKRMEDNRIRYGVDFKDQRHLPSRIMKNVLEVEQLPGGKHKYWFWEFAIPLYLIKEYEERFNDVVAVPSCVSGRLSKLQRRQLKDSRKDAFSFLLSRRDNVEKCSCASCRKHVFLRDTIVCHSCQGFCHIDCTVVTTNEHSQGIVICTTCCNTKGLPHSETTRESPTTPLPLPNSAALKPPKLAAYSNPDDESGYHVVVKKDAVPFDYPPEVKQATSASEHKRKICNWGLIWRKKREDTGFDSAFSFRSKHIILKGNPDKSWLRPVCKACNKEYNLELMYVHCEKCNSWFHAEAVELDESRLYDLVGFKCCRCRRIKPPPCPYSDEPEKPVIQRSRNRPLKHENELADTPECATFEMNDSEFFYEQDLLGYITDSFPGDSYMPMNDSSINGDYVADAATQEHPLPLCHSSVENATENDSTAEIECNTAAFGAKKLPVRRQSKHQVEDENALQLETYDDGEGMSSWHTLTGLPEVNYDDMEFEPQTYFSFTELLAGEGDQINGCDPSGTGSGNSNGPSSVISEEGDNCIADDRAIRVRVPCSKCGGGDPPPDLSCSACGVILHGYCSPWVESQAEESGWRCGNCREWR